MTSKLLKLLFVVILLIAVYGLAYGIYVYTFEVPENPMAFPYPNRYDDYHEIGVVAIIGSLCLATLDIYFAVILSKAAKKEVL